ncbi:MAG: extracellular solute-binding protein [Pseudomonadota bacterium]
MCRLALALGLIVLAIAGTGAHAFEVEDRRVFAVSDPTATLRVISTTDTAVFAPTILAFQQREPTVAVDYIATSSTELMKALQQDGGTFDIAISSAMDLQIKLANDGLALSHGSAATARLPDWAKWRDRVFAFTSEPATVIMRRDAFGPEGSPRTRRELVEMLRSLTINSVEYFSDQDSWEQPPI